MLHHPITHFNEAIAGPIAGPKLSHLCHISFILSVFYLTLKVSQLQSINLCPNSRKQHWFFSGLITGAFCQEGCGSWLRFCQPNVVTHLPLQSGLQQVKLGADTMDIVHFWLRQDWTPLAQCTVAWQGQRTFSHCVPRSGRRHSWSVDGGGVGWGGPG